MNITLKINDTFKAFSLEMLKTFTNFRINENTDLEDIEDNIRLYNDDEYLKYFIDHLNDLETVKIEGYNMVGVSIKIDNIKMFEYLSKKMSLERFIYNYVDSCEKFVTLSNRQCNIVKDILTDRNFNSKKELKILDDFKDFKTFTLEDLKQYDLFILYENNDCKRFENENWKNKEFYEYFIDHVHDLNIPIGMDGYTTISIIYPLIKFKYTDAVKYLCSHKKFNFKSNVHYNAYNFVYSNNFRCDSINTYFNRLIINATDLIELLEKNSNDILNYKLYRKKDSSEKIIKKMKSEIIKSENDAIRLHVYDLIHIYKI